jgi:Ala-tRNA(Pro) deacylase
MQETEMYRRIVSALDAAHAAYERYEHEHVHHSHEAATIRGTKLEEAAKALIFRVGTGSQKRLVMCVVSGHRKIDTKTVKNILNEKNFGLASPDDVLHASGCTVGSVPPFGNLFTAPIPVYCDADVLSREHLVFSAGSHHHSIRMRTADWRRIVEPIVDDIGKEHWNDA